jgi:hypothetical protein
MFSDKFDEWVKVPGNAEKWEASFEQWEEDMKTPEGKAKYEAELK